MQKNLTQEQLIRQQLLAKQKQLLELQQKKLELELEQTKAQLVSRTVDETFVVGSQFPLGQYLAVLVAAVCYFFLMLGKCSYFSARAMQVDLGFLSSICYLKSLIYSEVKSEVLAFLFLTSLQNDTCLWSLSSTSSCSSHQTGLFQLYLLLQNKET